MSDYNRDEHHDEHHDEILSLIAERDEARHHATLQTALLETSRIRVTSVEARLNEAREAVKRYLYALSVNNGTDGADDRAAALDNLASIGGDK